MSGAESRPLSRSNLSSATRGPCPCSSHVATYKRSIRVCWFADRARTASMSPAQCLFRPSQSRRPSGCRPQRSLSVRVGSIRSIQRRKTSLVVGLVSALRSLQCRQFRAQLIAMGNMRFLGSLHFTEQRSRVGRISPVALQLRNEFALLGDLSCADRYAILRGLQAGDNEGAVHRRDRSSLVTYSYRTCSWRSVRLFLSTLPTLDYGFPHQKWFSVALEANEDVADACSLNFHWTSPTQRSRTSKAWCRALSQRHSDL
jgi:hypothetical protein